MLVIFSSPPFYTTYIQLPSGESVSHKIQHNPKFWPFFQVAISAIDGSHIHTALPAFVRHNYWNCKGFVSQNCLFACDFDLKFVYSLMGWEGSATDARIYADAIATYLCLPDGKYFLGDAGFPLCKMVLVPYWGIRYRGRQMLGETLMLISLTMWSDTPTDLQPKKSYLTSIMHQLEMSLNRFLVSL